jgi:hypothetical protein
MSVSNARERLEAEQAGLVQALVAGGSVPAGFDEERVRLTARSLINKRLRDVASVWPALVRCLGESFRERFATFAERNPPPAAGGPLADGRAFAATLPASELDDDARLELMLVDLRRRRLPVRMRWLPGARRLVAGVRLPWVGVRVVSMRVPGARAVE